MADKKILHIDDSSADRELIREAVEAADEGWSVESIAGLDELERHLEDFAFDLVLTDLDIGELSGLDVLDRVHAEHPDVPVLVVTGTGSESLAVEALRRGAQDYLVKGSRRVRLLPDAIRRALAHKEERSRRRAAEIDRDRFFKTSLALLAICDSGGHFLRANPAYERTLGWSQEELLGRTFLELVHPDDRRVTEAAMESLSAGEPVESLATRCRTKDGQVRWLLWALQPGEERWYVSATDITERRRSIESLELLRMATNQAGEAIVITDATGRIMRASEPFTRFSGQSLDDTEDEPLEVLFDHHGSRRRHIWAALQSGQRWEGRVRPERTDELDIEVTITPILGDHEQLRHLVAVFRDVTEEVQLQAQLRQAQKMEALGQLAGGVAHDFNNLLQAILGFTRFALDTDLPEETRSDLQEVVDAADRGSDLVRQLLQFSRREVAELRPADPVELTAAARRFIDRMLGETYEVVHDVGSDLPQVRADSGQIEQVLMNLCVNARDAMPEGGTITIGVHRTSVERGELPVKGFAPGEYVEISVSDHGIGMAPSVEQHAFEPFFTTKGAGKGTGLGLSTVYGIVKQHEGFVDIVSEEGEGTMVRVLLPLADKHRARREEDRSADARPGGAECILLAEDDELVRAFAVRVLERAGYRVIVACDGQEALDLIAASSSDIDLAILDVIMPEVSGEAVARSLAEANPEAAVLFATGYSMGVLDSTVRPPESARVLTKPYEVSELLQGVRAALDGDSAA